MHESESEVTQSCLILSDSMDWSLPGSSVHGIFQARVLEWVAIAFSTSRHDYRKNHHFDIWTFVCKAMSAFLLLCHNFSFKEQVSFNFMAAVPVHSDFGAQESKVCHCFNFPPSICHEMMGLGAMILVSWMLSLKPAFSLSSFILIKRLFGSSSLSAIRVVSFAYLRLLIFLPAILIPACA